MSGLSSAIGSYYHILKDNLKKKKLDYVLWSTESHQLTTQKKKYLITGTGLLTLYPVSAALLSHGPFISYSKSVMEIYVLKLEISLTFPFSSLSSFQCLSFSF